MYYMDPDILCPQKADKLNISLSLCYSYTLISLKKLKTI